MLPEIFLVCALSLPVEEVDDRYRNLVEFLKRYDATYEVYLTEDLAPTEGKWKYTGYVWEGMRVYVRRGA